jgi:hypothetical protein
MKFTNDSDKLDLFSVKKGWKKKAGSCLKINKINSQSEYKPLSLNKMFNDKSHEYNRNNEETALLDGCKLICIMQGYQEASAS